MRRAIDHTLMSGAVLAVVITGLVLLDARVRRAFASLAASSPSAELAQVGSIVRDLGGVVLTAIREQSIANAPLMIFVVIATVLMLFMVRT